jgi:hypothetical protein
LIERVGSCAVVTGYSLRDFRERRGTDAGRAFA